MAACVTCLLQCLIPTSHTSAKSGFPCSQPTSNRRRANESPALHGHLKTSRPVLHRVVGHGGRNVQVTLYRQLRALFDQIGTWASERSGEPDLRGPQESLAALAGEMFSQEIDLSVEAIRTERAQALVAYVELCGQTSLPIDEALQNSLKSWREVERSGPVRQILDRAIVNLR